jgi:hypothetical protein
VIGHRIVQTGQASRDLVELILTLVSVNSLPSEQAKKIVSELYARDPETVSEFQRKAVAAVELEYRETLDEAIREVEEATDVGPLERLMGGVLAKLDDLKHMEQRFGVSSRLIRRSDIRFTLFMLKLRLKRYAIMAQLNAELDALDGRHERLIVVDLPLVRRVINRARRNGLSEDTHSSLYRLRLQEIILSREKVRLISGSERLVFPLGELDVDYSTVVGPKVAKLGDILSVVRNENASVPEAVALSVQAFRRFIDDNDLAQPGYKKRFTDLIERMDWVYGKHVGSTRLGGAA